MVFLFPGVIFRRLYFSGDIRNKFDSGSNFERILWGILLSIFCLALFTITTTYVDGYTNNLISDNAHLSESQILCVFEDIYKNQYPDILRSRKTLLSVFIAFFCLYAFSALVGFFANKIVYSFKLQKSISFLQFGNQWEYLTVSNKITNDNHKFGDRCETQIDIKTKNDELLTGTYKQFIINDENSVESIVIKDAYKYYTFKKPDDNDKINEVKAEIENNSISKIEHLDTETKYIFKKKITGNLFVINKQDVENISIRYVNISNIFDKKLDFINAVFSIILMILAILSFINAIWDLGIYDFVGRFRRIVFSLTFLFNLICIATLVYSFIEPKNDSTNKSRFDTLVLLIYSLLPYFYIFALISFAYFALIMFCTLPLLSYIFTLVSKSNTSIPESNDSTNL